MSKVNDTSEAISAIQTLAQIANRNPDGLVLEGSLQSLITWLHKCDQDSLDWNIQSGRN
ncbi:MAG: hypothetical protein JWQ50_6164 [Caballeronia mineralivorans]|nr:hypothetical protein [Caballeronia mineralivorans]